MVENKPYACFLMSINILEQAAVKLDKFHPENPHGR
jgi:hypothetical protein